MTPPQLLGIAPQPVPQETVLRIAKVKHVEKVALVAGGGVRLSGHPLQLLAVEPAQFRSWTPKPVAEHPEVWSAIARGEVVADPAVMKRLGMILGEEYQVDNGPRLRIAASAALGFPNIDGLISKDLGRRLGFSDGVVVLVHGEKVSGTRVRKLMGTGSSVVPIGVVKERPAEQKAAAPKPDPGRPPRELPGALPALGRRLPRAVVDGPGGDRPGREQPRAQQRPVVCRGARPDAVHAGDLARPTAWTGTATARPTSGAPTTPCPARPTICATPARPAAVRRLRKAVWAYNHSWDYVDKVLGLAGAYARAYP